MLRNRTTRRRLAATGTTALALLALSGCYRVDLAMTVNTDETISGTATLAVNENTLALAELDIEDMLPNGAEDENEYIKSIDPYEQDELVGKTVTIEGAPLDYFADEGEHNITIEHVEDTYVLSGGMNLNAEDADPGAEAAAALLGGEAEILVAFTFPGEVLETNGSVQEGTNTVTWTLDDLSEPLDMHVVAKDEPASGLPAWALGVAGGVALLVVAGATVVVRRHGQRLAEDDDELGTDAPVDEDPSGDDGAAFDEWSTALGGQSGPTPPRFEQY